MLGKDGKTVRVAPSQVADMRKGNYAVQPDNPGAQKMVTPDGQITYALPGEVDSFRQSGHTLIHPDGNFQVQPIRVRPSTLTDGGMETPDETMSRAANVAKALGPQGMDKATTAEKNWWTSKEGLSDEAAGLVNVGTAGAETLATLAGGSGTAQAAKAGLSALGENAEIQMLKSSPRLYAEHFLKNNVKQAVKATVKATAKEAANNPIRTAGILTAGASAAWYWLTRH
jgi:hypothetical protein